MTNILIDDAIHHMQLAGGISTLWRALGPLLREALPDFTFDASQPADVFLSTYYQPAPDEAKSIVVVYDYIADRYPGIPKYSPDILWKRAAVAQADAVVAISEWTASDVLRFDGKQASVAYPATSLARVSHDAVQAFKAKYSLPDNYVLIVGRRDLYKNVSTYWQAARMMQPPPFTLCVGGEEAAIPSGKRVHLDASELSAAYTGAMCLVYPSLYEGFGLPVLEAYACGCPVICGDGGALAEINGATCVVDVTRPREIAQALLKMQDPGTRIGHILKGYDVAQRFSWASMAASVATVIRDVAKKETTVESLFISSPVNVLRGDAARAALTTTNDAAHYTEGKGVLAVPLERWQQAQQYERATWLDYGLMLTEDRNAEHAAMFDGYKALPEKLGHVIELGCGPFTNMRNILPGRDPSTVTLLDPMVHAYRDNHPNCAYQDSRLCGYHALTEPTAIEDFETDIQFDTVIMINVLHHCQDVHKVFNWINTHLKTGGYLVFHEPARDIDPAQFYDVGHPISFNQGVIEAFLTGYEQVYRNGDYFIGVKK